MEQRSDEWFQARSMIPTASKFDKIITATGIASKQAGDYMNELLAHWLMQKFEDPQGDQKFQSAWMARGEEMEVEAIAYYEMNRNVDVKTVGFCLSDDARTGCSPDGLVEDGGLELKCPKASVHIAYLLGQKIPTKYIPQVQGSMLITGCHWWDFMSYHPDMEPLIVRVPRNVEYLALMKKSLDLFADKMDIKRAKLIDMGYAHAA